MGNSGRGVLVTGGAGYIGSHTCKVDTFGKLDILFNNAGIPMSFTPVENVKEDLWDRIQDVNVKSIFLGAKYAVPYMKRQGGGVILNTASISGVRPRPGLIAYSASKAAAIMLTKALAIELAASKIRVNCLNPVAAETPMLPKFMSDQALTPEKFEEGRKRFTDTVPLGPLARSEDVANAALFLVSDEASLITGVSLDPNATPSNSLKLPSRNRDTRNSVQTAVEISPPQNIWPTCQRPRGVQGRG